MKTPTSLQKDVFDELVTNNKFIEEAAEARRELLKNPDKFTNLSKKYHKLIASPQKTTPQD